MSLKQTLTDDMKASMKAGDKHRLGVLRMVLAAIKQQEVDTRKDLGETDVLSIVTKMVKQRRDSVSQFRDGGRDDLADAEEAEIAILETYLPTPLSEQEIDDLIEAVISETGANGMKDMGRVMGELKARAEGRADLGALSGKVKARLG